MNLVLMVLRGLATLAVNPALGGGGLSRERLAAYLSLGADIIQRGEDGYEQFKAFAEEIDAMVKENRQPSQKDFDALRARDDAAWARIKAAQDKIIAAREAEASAEANQGTGGESGAASETGTTEGGAGTNAGDQPE